MDPYYIVICGDIEEKVGFNCSVCDKTFRHKKTLYQHSRSVHKIELVKKCIPSSTIVKKNQEKRDHDYCRPKKSRLICPDCDDAFSNYEQLRVHLDGQHQIKCLVEELVFDSFEEFKQWKEQMEQNMLSSYTKDTARKQLKSGSRLFFNCHRSYGYKHKGKKIRALKKLGTNKMGRACPSRLEVKIDNEGSKVKVKYWKTHFGHEEQIERVALNRDIRLEIAGKLKDGMSIDSILDHIRDASLANETIERKSLLKRKDLHNIIREFKIDYATKRHQDVDAGPYTNEFVASNHTITPNLLSETKKTVISEQLKYISQLIKKEQINSESEIFIERHLDMIIDKLQGWKHERL